MKKILINRDFILFSIILIEFLFCDLLIFNVFVGRAEGLFAGGSGGAAAPPGLRKIGSLFLLGSPIPSPRA